MRMRMRGEMTKSAMYGRWRYQRIGVLCRLSVLKLGRLPLPLLVFADHFSTLFGQDGTTVDPFAGARFAALPQDAQGFYCVSAPQPSHRKRFHWTRDADGARALMYTPRWYERAAADLTLGEDAYLKTMSSKSRATLKRKVRKLKERSGGEFDFTVFRTPEEMRAFHAEALPLSQRTYQHRRLDMGLPSDPEFLAEMDRLAANDQVRGYILRLDGKPAAYMYSPVEGEAAIFKFLGYDPEFSRLSAGGVMIYLALTDLMREGRFKVFDFMSGEGQHKDLFSTFHYTCSDIWLLKPTFRALWPICLQSITDTISSVVGKLLDLFDLRARVRRMLRGW